MGLEIEMDVFVVIGSTGEYSDRGEWAVAAYTDEALAKQHVLMASLVADAILARAEASDDPWDVRDTATNPFDARMSMDYTGTRYFLRSVPLLTELPNAEIVEGGAA